MTRVYIAGPVTGVRDHNKDMFEVAAELIRNEGMIPINPTEISDYGMNEGWSYKDFIDYGISLLIKCDRICMLPGFSRSTGAKLEKTYAEAVHMPIMYVSKQKYGGDWMIR